MKPADLPNHDAPRARRRAPLVVACVVLVVILVAWFWPKHQVVTAPAAVPVNAGHPVNRDFPIRVAAVGTVQALNTVDVKVRVDGQLQRVAFTEGQDVKAGQLLAQLDQGPLTAQLHQAEAAQRKDQASLDNARLDLARYSQLVGIGAATAQAVDTAKAQVDALSATVAADAALVQSDRLQLSFTTLAAPFTGRCRRARGRYRRDRASGRHDRYRHRYANGADHGVVLRAPGRAARTARQSGEGAARGERDHAFRRYRARRRHAGVHRQHGRSHDRPDQAQGFVHQPG
ncbi:hypothetical protein BZM27_51905, partial [Paraburkholderia steynii]